MHEQCIPESQPLPFPLESFECELESVSHCSTKVQGMENNKDHFQCVNLSKSIRKRIKKLAPLPALGLQWKKQLLHMQLTGSSPGQGTVTYSALNCWSQGLSQFLSQSAPSTTLVLI